MIVGNLTRDPELRTTTDGTSVCSFTVAVNRPKREGHDPEADYFNVSVWREQGENCAKYLSKGKKVCVIGPVTCRGFVRNDGSAGASLEIRAQDVEFLSPKGDGNSDTATANATAQATDAQAGFTPVEMPEKEFPF